MSSKLILILLFCAPLDLMSLIQHLLEMLARLQRDSPALTLRLLLILLQQSQYRVFQKLQ